MLFRSKVAAVRKRCNRCLKILAYPHSDVNKFSSIALILIYMRAFAVLRLINVEYDGHFFKRLHQRVQGARLPECRA